MSIKKSVYSVFGIVIIWSYMLYCCPVALAAGFVIDHKTIDTSDTLISQTYLDQARSKTIIFNHQSVGYNILDGLKDLAKINPTKYASFLAIKEYTAGSNGDPISKVNGFSNLLNSLTQAPDVSMMKFCYVDNTQPAETIWSAYKTKMISLEQQYPHTIFVWWTMPVMTTGDAIRDSYNALVRDYVSQNGKILFDIADIESHDPAGNPITNSRHESLYAGYSSDGGHLTLSGRQRMARAWWWMMARISGWNPSAENANGIQSTPAASLPSRAISPSMSPISLFHQATNTFSDEKNQLIIPEKNIADSDQQSKKPITTILFDMVRLFIDRLFKRS
jgi:hypothetical protein